MQSTLATPSRLTPSPVRTHVSSRRLRRRGVDLLAAAILLLILQTGLAPYDFLFSRTEDASHPFFTHSIDRITRPDILSNIALYVPYGLLVCVALAARVRRRGAAIGLTLVSAAILSVFIEWMQSFSPSRVSSLIDVAANVLGAGIGIVLSICFGPLVPKLVEAARTELVLRPDGVLLKAYVAVLCIAAAAPFDLSFDVAHLRKSWTSACETIPSLGHADVAATQASNARFGVQRGDYDRWASQKRWSRWGAEGVSFAVFAWLATAWLRREYGFGRTTSALLCSWVGLFLAVGLSILQLPIRSRGFDAKDVVFRTLGLLVGCGFAWLESSKGSFQKPSPLPLSLGGRGVVGIGPKGDAALSSGRRVRAPRWSSSMSLLGWVAGLYIVYTGLVPIGVDFSHMSEVVSWSTLVPFSTYPIGRFDERMCDVMEKLASYALLAGLFAGAGRATRGRNLRKELIGWTSRCATLAAAIEVAQLVIRPRTPSLTDVLLAATGAVLGCLLQDRIASVWSEAARRRAKLAGTGTTQAPPRRTFTPLDDLIATLAEPQADAPVEADMPPETAPNPQDP